MIQCVVMVSMMFSLYFGWCAFEEYQSIAESEVKVDALRKLVLKEEKIKDKEMLEETVEIKEEPEENQAWKRRIAFDDLKKINKDIVGWIYIPDTSVDYPILIGDTDDTYLHKDFEGNDSEQGSIFSYADTDREFREARTVLFGHNMSQYAMFGELKRYVREEDFRNEHKKLYVYTEKSMMELEIFSVFICEDTDSIFYDDAELGTVEYQELLQTLSERNQYADMEKKNIHKSYHCKSYTLVTCSGRSGTNRRLVISAIVTRESYILD